MPNFHNCAAHEVQKSIRNHPTGATWLVDWPTSETLVSRWSQLAQTMTPTRAIFVRPNVARCRHFLDEGVLSSAVLCMTQPVFVSLLSSWSTGSVYRQRPATQTQVTTTNLNHHKITSYQKKIIPICRLFFLHICNSVIVTITLVVRTPFWLVHLVWCISPDYVRVVWCRMRTTHSDWLTRLATWPPQLTYPYSCFPIMLLCQLVGSSQWDNVISLRSCCLYWSVNWHDSIPFTPVCWLWFV